MSRGVQNVRIGINSQLLLLGSLLSHFIGGGSFIHTRDLILSITLSSILLYAFKNKFLAGPSLALIVAITQSAAHIIMGGMSNSNTLMLFSHISGGLVTYWVIVKSERIWERLLTAASYFISHLNFTIPIKTPKVIVPSIFSPFRVETLLDYGAHIHRGPPERKLKIT
jgi:hypothetical protein